MPTSLLCETVTGRSMAELLAARDNARLGDMVELRLDGVADLDVARCLHGRAAPMIVTCRPTWEGGAFSGSEEERLAILTRALDAGADFVDVEWLSSRGFFRSFVATQPERVVLSSHDFTGVPSDLDARARAMRAVGTAVIKVAVTTPRLVDTLPLLEIARSGNAVVIGMGQAGMPTRLLASRYGSRWTYAGDAVAPGQVPAQRMVEEFGFRRTRPDSRVFAVVSSSALHSLSPVMHNAAFAAAGLDATYVPLAASSFADFLTFAEALGVEGASVTIPYKIDALQAAASCDDMARAVGAANTLRRRAGAWEAINTDVAGFLAPLERVLPGQLRGMRAAVLGAGGAARAVVVALNSRGAHVTVHARHPERAAALAGALPADAGTWPPRPGSWDLLVNCTPLGGADLIDESPLPGGPFTGPFVYDLTYGRRESRLLRDARAAGCVVLDGLPMLIAQAERQFEWWTGSSPATGVMGAAVQRRLRNETGFNFPGAGPEN